MTGASNGQPYDTAVGATGAATDPVSHATHRSWSGKAKRGLHYAEGRTNLAPLPPIRDLHIGVKRLRILSQDGASVTCRVYRLAEDRVALDFNHPLAGQPLTLFVRVVNIAQPA